MKTKLNIPNPKKARRYFARKMAFTTGPVELNRWLGEGQGVAVVDVRDAQDYKRGHIPGAVSLPKDRWARPSGLRKAKANVLYCYSQVCHLAAAAAVEFSDKGFPVMELEGGFEAWKDCGFPVEKEKPARRKAPKKIEEPEALAESVAGSQPEPQPQTA